MKVILLALFFPLFASAFMVDKHMMTKTKITTQLDMVSRRDAILGIIAATMATPKLVNAFSQQLEDDAYVEQAQMYTGGKVDLNSAFVVRAF